MRLNVPGGRFILVSIVLAAVVASSGCSWFRRESKLYAKDATSRPLEVPPDLDLPRTDAAVVVPAAPGETAPAAATANASGFSVSGSRDEVFGRVGEVLGGIDGLTVASRAQLLGVYDVSYQNSNFLVRVSASESGAYVSAVDPRGMPATGEAATRVIAELKTALGGN